MYCINTGEKERKFRSHKFKGKNIPFAYKQRVWKVCSETLYFFINFMSQEEVSIGWQFEGINQFRASACAKAPRSITSFDLFRG